MTARHEATRSGSAALVLAWIAAAAAGCSPLAQQDKISACGGFGQASQALDGEEPAYCEAELLRWRHDAATRTLTLTNTRVTLNCCGEHSMTVHEEDGVYVVTERDAPEQLGPLPGSTARCSCMCVFDFEVQVQGVEARPVTLRLVREVTDAEGGPETVWQGGLDLRAGQGSVIVDDSETLWCEASGA